MSNETKREVETNACPARRPCRYTFENGDVYCGVWRGGRLARGAAGAGATYDMGPATRQRLAQEQAARGLRDPPPVAVARDPPPASRTG